MLVPFRELIGGRSVPGPTERPGPRRPTVIITNHHHATVKALLERYARRMTIEQRLAEAIRSFHLRFDYA
jgi:hypothetical protein